MEKSQPTRPIFSVSDFIAIANQTFEYAYPVVEIEGEVASFKVNHDKFVFFDIKDSEGSIGCFMTVWQLRISIEDGMKVVISASPKLTNWGKFSLTVRSIRPSGEGALKKSFELLKLKLEKEGLFAPERKRSLPKFPSHVAVISSVASAGYADFIKILDDRWGGVNLDVVNVQVQGADAPDQIIKAINYFNQQEKLPEVIIIIRGGGSADDLAVFNDEPLVRAVAGSRIPTLVGIGHEIDESLVDLVADVRASTPSNVAQILVPDKNEVKNSVRLQLNSILPRVINLIDQEKRDVKNQVNYISDKFEFLVDKQLQTIIMQRKILEGLNPMSVLARGYSIITGKFEIGSTIEIETEKLLIKAEVRDVKRK